MCESGGGEAAKARWKFDMMCAGSSEPSLVANSISTQISYTGSNVAGSKMDDCIIVGKREKNVFIFHFILFDRSVTFYASMFCDSGPYMHCRLCDSVFHLFLPTFIKMGSSNPPLLLVKRVGSRSGSTNGISRRRYTVLHFVGAV